MSTVGEASAEGAVPDLVRDVDQWRKDLTARAREALAARHTADRVARRIALDFVDMLLDEGQRKGWTWQQPSTVQAGSD